MHPVAKFVFLAIALTASSCATFTIPADKCPPDTQQLENCPPLGAIKDSRTEALLSYSAWIKPSDLPFDPINKGKQAKIPIQSAQVKFIGPQDIDALNSIAAKIWMIESAEHTIDMMYYIYTPDLIGKALMGALCDAVARGVDVRFMVDSLGSILLWANNLRALESCRMDAGFMLSIDGKTTIYKARVQTVIFNALSRFRTSPNRRSHDKLLIVDGYFPDKAAVMTGGRNISLAYYGVNADGIPNPKTFRDAEILIKTGRKFREEKYTVGEVSEIYYSLLFYFRGNKRIRISALGNPRAQYASSRQEYRDSLERLKSFPLIKERLAAMPEYFDSGFLDTKIRLAHEMGNLVNKRVVRNAVENLDRNPNSITRLLGELSDENNKLFRMVSPYLFLARYTDKSGNVIHDDAVEIHKWLAADPERRVEIITNSVITSDNGGTQSVIDMDVAPRLLLSEDMQKKWLDNPKETELNPDLMNSKEWTEMVNHPQITIYQSGRLDSTFFGGDVVYAKMHAKYIATDSLGFVGTANFDYRSRLYNNEMGFFFSGDDLLKKLNRDFDFLAQRSYRWGSQEWLEMRRLLREGSGPKSRLVKRQRRTYKFLRATGLKWWF
jgi:phosphatidylserine/phosphatidylglycerophosphate/cardiolipin synthase-like enzyme